MQKHITILSILHLINSGLILFGAGIVFMIIFGGGLLSGDAEAIGITAGVGLFIGTIMAVIAAPGLIGGLGLLKRKNWAGILVLIIGCINLLNFPFGTALGIYSIWVVVQPETKSILAA